MTSDDIVRMKKFAKSGVSKLVKKRQLLVLEVKEKESEIKTLSQKILRLMLEYDIKSANIEGFPVSAIVDATYTSFDRAVFINYLVEHKVSPKLIAKAEKKATETKDKAPHVKIQSGE